MNFSLNSNNSLPSDGTNGCLIGRAWIPGTLSGPSPIILRDHQVFDISEDFNTVTELLEQEHPVQALAKIQGNFWVQLMKFLPIPITIQTQIKHFF